MLFYFPCAVETHIAVSDNVLVNGHLDTRFTHYTQHLVPPPFALRAPTHAAINVWKSTPEWRCEKTLDGWSYIDYVLLISPF